MINHRVILFDKRIVKMINMFFFFMCLVAFSASHRIEGIDRTLKEDLELERKLKIVNKPPVKSIHTKFGYIVDCIDINKQPAFDHPSLKNHKLQRKPSFQNTNKKTSAKISPSKPIFGLGKDECPTGTVPIRRTTKDEFVQSQSFLTSLSTDNTNKNYKNHAAKVIVQKHRYTYYGVSGKNSVYNPRVTNDQVSTSIMWVQNGSGGDKNRVAIGWQVFPRIYKNNKTHMFATWTKDNFQTTGCLNQVCSGFVQISKTNHLGQPIDKTSMYGGKNMEEIDISIFKDAVTNNWWVSIGNDPIGYYPAALFSNLAHADQVAWGGITSASVGALSPPMGSGHFPDRYYNHSCYFRNVAFQDASRKNYGPEPGMTDSYSDSPRCYGADYYGDQKRMYGFSLQFGGPGGNC